ncbi:amino acid ABC transporter permease [Palleronia sp. LCG004]|uniref:amino acid ABC transporter permease n=1 Tax=Palleronia sp. LCG004 TaxID=3079304 RepID=UPI0029433C9F|nr:amino acid ABC transporter permease [Palleronia sp. LCG004]WOI57894.1 amino acid ABC transporter permease [Palleronia sp. LCG004]
MTLDLELFAYAIPVLLTGALFTLKIGLAIAAACLVLGALLTIPLSSRNRFVSGLARAYIAAMRGTPPLILILISFYVLPAVGLLLSPALSGATALSLYFTAYVATAIRGAIASIEAGQIEAALCIGMGWRQRLLRILLPQAWPVVLPALVGLMIGLFKETALLSVISVPELTFQTKQAVARTYAPFEIYLLAALAYWLWSAVLEALGRRLESRATRFRRPRPMLTKGTAQ